MMGNVHRVVVDLAFSFSVIVDLIAVDFLG